MEMVQRNGSLISHAILVACGEPLIWIALGRLKVGGMGKTGWKKSVDGWRFIFDACWRCENEFVESRQGS